MPISSRSMHSSHPSVDTANDDFVDNILGGSSVHHPQGRKSKNQSFVSMSDRNLQRRPSHTESIDETTSLLSQPESGRMHQSITLQQPETPRRYRSYKSGSASTRRYGTLSRKSSFGTRLVNALSSSRDLGSMKRKAHLKGSTDSLAFDNRVWYDQYTSIDWVHDNIADAYRAKELLNKRGPWGRISRLLDASQGWVLVAVIGCITALIAFCVDTVEVSLYDIKTGYCSTSWFSSKKMCCNGVSMCKDWVRWSQLFDPQDEVNPLIDYATYISWVVALALLSCSLTLLTRTVVPSAITISTFDENFAADSRVLTDNDKGNTQAQNADTNRLPPMVYYPAAGSGVAEIKVITSGFVLHGYLGVRTLVIKTIALTLSVASGLSVGKEGPFVHIATCVGNIASRMFSKYHYNDAKRREALSAAAAGGVAVAFGAPIGGVLFSLEEVSYYFPPKTLFRTFFCCIVAALSLKFLNPYGTGKIVIFEVRYLLDWRGFELGVFVLLGALGGLLGALFIKATKFWATTFRTIPTIKKYPLFEVALIALITGIVSWWNRYARIPVAELMFELAAPCNAFTEAGTGLCATRERIPETIKTLGIAFAIKCLLTTITFGIKVPAGIYVPSMVCGGLLGRIVGHIVQLLALNFAGRGIFASCSINGAPEDCVIPGVYAMIAAGATMCGVTRLSVTLVVILFELTGSLDHVLPFSLAILVSKWTADAIEPLSIYDLLTDMNSYPFLDNKIRPVFTTELGDMVSHHVRTERVIDLSDSPMVRATRLRNKLTTLQRAGELDGGLPIIRDEMLIGLIPAPDLEFALDRLENEDSVACLMNPEYSNISPVQTGTRTGFFFADDHDMENYHHYGSTAAGPANNRNDNTVKDPTDFTPFIDPAPMALDVHSPMDLVYECFVKLGLRYICVLRDGRYAGLVHKKAFVKYTKDLEARKHD